VPRVGREKPALNHVIGTKAVALALQSLDQLARHLGERLAVERKREVLAVEANRDDVGSRRQLAIARPVEVEHQFAAGRQDAGAVEHDAFERRFAEGIPAPRSAKGNISTRVAVPGSVLASSLH
jgi:hypothetical protein